MSDQALNLDSQLIESELLESDLDSDLLAEDISLTDSSDLLTPLETSELEIKSSEPLSNESTNDINLFNDSEIEASSLYSDSAEFNNASKLSTNNESDPEFEVLNAEANTDNSSVQTIVVGDEGGTQFTFNFAEGTPQEAIDGTIEAGEVWSSILTDDVNIEIDFDFTTIEQDIPNFEAIGGTISNSYELPYERVREALVNDVTSVDDSTAIASLPEANINLLTNNTSENNGSDTPYLDNNNSANNNNIRINTANAKALGLSIEDIAEAFDVTPEEVAAQLETNIDLPDAEIVINSEQSWDFDPSDGINADSNDFVGTVVHEIGHGLGFSTGSSDLDIIAANSVGDIINTPGLEEIQELIADTELEALAGVVNIDQFISENEYTLKTLDLFRYSPESFEQGAKDFTTGNIDNKYFSIDGGTTIVAPMATGVNTGDGTQLQHWKDGLNIGLLDPTIASGVNNLSDNDLLAFDVIGWDVA